MWTKDLMLAGRALRKRPAGAARGARAPRAGPPVRVGMGEFEQLVLLAVLRLDNRACGNALGAQRTSVTGHQRGHRVDAPAGRP